MRSSLLAVAAVVAAVALALSGCGGSQTATPAKLTSLALMLDWTPNPDHTAIFLAQERGYFRDAGLRLRVTSPADPTTPLKLLAAGRVDLAISYEPELFFAGAKKLPVVAVASVIPRALDSLISLRPLPSLAGRSVGITGVPTDDAFLATILAQSHVPAASVEVVHVGYNLLPALLSHKVDAILGGYSNVEGVQLQQQGQHPSITPVDQAGVPEYDELVVAADRSRLARDPAYADAVRSFVTALGRADRAAQAEPAAALAAVAAHTKSPQAFLRRSVPATLPLLQGAPCLTRAAWSRFGAWMTARELLTHPVPAADVVTSDYLPSDCRA